MSDFDLYEGQNCRCGNDPMCNNCGSGAAYEQQCQLEAELEQNYQEMMRREYGDPGGSHRSSIMREE